MIQKVITLACAMLLVSASYAAAQDATLTGHVVDASGGAVPGAAVVLRNTGTTVSTEAITNSDGIFGFPSTRPGAYEVSVTLAGFAPGRFHSG